MDKVDAESSTLTEETTRKYLQRYAEAFLQ